MFRGDCGENIVEKPGTVLFCVVLRQDRNTLQTTTPKVQAHHRRQQIQCLRLKSTARDRP